MLWEASVESLDQLMQLMAAHGAARVYVKEMAENDNAKNQIYLGGDFSSLNIIPFTGLEDDSTVRAGSKRDRVKAAVRFYWLYEEGLYQAPNAKLILYPRYPEVRLSGLLQGAVKRPSKLISSRAAGRLLFLGVTSDGEVLGYVAARDDLVSMEFREKGVVRNIGVFAELSTQDFSESSTRQELIESLRRIHQMGWIPSQRRNSSGEIIPYGAPNGGGYTLESVLGITPNGFSAPDFLGWEIKQYGVNNFDLYRPQSPITLMTPEPTGGEYAEHGAEWFVRAYGYADRQGRADRLNVGGVYRANADAHHLTGLVLIVSGYDATAGMLTDINEGVALVTKSGTVAAIWYHRDLLAHWARKHAQAAYVPSLVKTAPREYRYGALVSLGEHTDYLKLVDALARGAVYYDPGIKLEGASTPNPRIKRRSQFRVSHSGLEALYKKFSVLDVMRDRQGGNDA